MNSLDAESSISAPIPTETAVSETPRKKKGLVVIGMFELLKGAMLLVLALGLLHFLHRDLQQSAEDLISKMRFDPDNRHIAGLLGKLGLVDDHRLKELSGLTCIYAALFLTEGIGLIRQKQWAEYLTIVATASFIPFEIYEVWQHATWIRVLLCVSNIAVLAYLAITIRREKQSE